MDFFLLFIGFPCELRAGRASTSLSCSLWSRLWRSAALALAKFRLAMASCFCSSETAAQGTCSRGSSFASSARAFNFNLLDIELVNHVNLTQMDLNELKSS